MDWRNWRLPVKVAAVLLVPVTVAVGAGVLQIRGYVVRADSYAAVGKLVTLRSAMGPLITGIQEERAFQAQRVDGVPPEPGAYSRRAQATDSAAVAVRDLANRTTTFGDVSTARFREVVAQLDGLPQLRDRVLNGTDVAGGVGGYSVVLRALLDFDQALVGEFGEPVLANTGVALHNLAMAAEQMSWQHATVLAGVSRGQLLSAEATQLEQSWIRYQDKLTDFAAIATPAQQEDYRLTVAGPDVDARNRMVQEARIPPKAPAPNRAPPPMSTKIPLAEWDTSSDGANVLVSKVLGDLEGELSSTAARMQDNTSDQAGLASMILLGSLLAAVGVGFVVGNNMLRSLLTLRRTALDVAQRKLPELVEDLRQDGAREVVIEPVAVHTTEEFGQLARAFDAVYQQAVGSAVEQARLRSGLRNTFVNLSRRSQGLVERQLRLMEELERKEENPQQLANLFKLDHLATRMRRNNENLMVLSGSDVTRRFSRPVPLADVLRAAASEIEQYQRVVVQTAPQVEVVGYAASDLVRLVAELLDNATAFSPPRSHVVIVGRPRNGGGVVIDVVDEGVGMTPEELDGANVRLRTGVTDELPVTRQMGLFVVARLAMRHQIEVTLADQGPHRDGLRAVVGVPADLVRTAIITFDRQADREADRPSAVVPSARPRPAMPAPVPAAPEGEWSSFRGMAIDDVTMSTQAGVTQPGSTHGGSAHPGSAHPGSQSGSAQLGSAQSGSTWFKGKLPTGEAPRHAAEIEPEPDGDLPKRRPRGNLVSERPDPGAAAPVRRDPDATRGFLANYQTGIRQGVRDSGEHQAGQENP